MKVTTTRFQESLTEAAVERKEGRWEGEEEERVTWTVDRKERRERIEEGTEKRSLRRRRDKDSSRDSLKM